MLTGVSEVNSRVSEIATFAFYLKKNGYRDSTISGTVHTLKALAHNVNLLNPESVRAYLAKAECSINRRGKVAEDLDRFYRYKVSVKKSLFGSLCQSQ